jgi:putative ABC transport system ATP-binding protein
MERNLFRYVWQHSRRDQLVILMIVLAGLPFYFWSLDLPKRIVNEAIQGRAYEGGKTTAIALDFAVPIPGFLGGGRFVLYEGFELVRMDYLFALSGLFLVLVLINGAFKYVINIRKGVMGERMLRRMRFDLVCILLRFPPESIRQVKPAEASSMVNSEVEPIGGFIGDAFVQPAYLGTQAATALTFILLQNLFLGLLAGGIVAVQAIVIPYLRREQLRLAKQRQIASRKLAGRLGELVDGITAVHNHGTVAYERAEIGGRLGELFFIRMNLFRRKFAVKYLNNLLAQLTPFFFYTIGGYFAIKGQLDIGQLVAVIAAYRDLPPPVKELIDWDQQRADVTIKYEQIVEQFSPPRLVPEDRADAPALDPARGGLEIDALRINDARGNPILETGTVTAALPATIALVGAPGSGRDSFARLIGRQIGDYQGKARIGGIEIGEISDITGGRAIAYVGPEPVLFPGSIRDNVIYSLLRREPGPAMAKDRAERHRLIEARASGNPPTLADERWIDLETAGASDAGSLDDRIVEAFRTIGFDREIYRLGLGGTLRPDRDQDLMHRLVAARAEVHDALAREEHSTLVEPFDPARFNRNATLGENLLFGVPIGDAFREANLPRHPFVRAIIEAEGLSAPLAEAGRQIAETMLEMFAGLPAGHPLFERFSFIAGGDLAEFEELIGRVATRRRSEAARADRDRLISLALAYSEPRHRLGLVDASLERRIVAARKSFREMISPEIGSSVEFYDPEHYNFAAPVRDNLLFGRVTYGVAGAEDKIAGVMRRALEALGLEQAIFRIGLDYQVGPAGRLMFGPQRAAVELARALIKRPQVLILDDAFRTFSGADARAALARIRERTAGATLVHGGVDDTDIADFDVSVRFEGGRITQWQDRRARQRDGNVPAPSIAQVDAGETT